MKTIAYLKGFIRKAYKLVSTSSAKHTKKTLKTYCPNVYTVIKGPSWYCDIFWNTCLSSLGSTIGYRMAEEGGRLI